MYLVKPPDGCCLWELVLALGCRSWGSPSWERGGLWSIPHAGRIVPPETLPDLWWDLNGVAVKKRFQINQGKGCQVAESTGISPMAGPAFSLSHARNGFGWCPQYRS